MTDNKVMSIKNWATIKTRPNVSRTVKSKQSTPVHVVKSILNINEISKTTKNTPTVDNKASKTVCRS